MALWIPSLEDFDVAIMNKLRNIKVDLKGDGKLEPIHVTYFTPEAQGEPDRDSLRPAIVVYLYDQVHDIRREQSTILHTTQNTPTDISMKEVATPMKFFYQFILITDYQTHMNEIVRQLNYLFPTRGFITLTSPEGEEVSYDLFQRSVDNGYSHQFLQYGANEQERIFRKIYRYHLFAEVDEAMEYTYKKVLERKFNAEEIK